MCLPHYCKIYHVPHLMIFVLAPSFLTLMHQNLAVLTLVGHTTITPVSLTTLDTFMVTCALIETALPHSPMMIITPVMHHVVHTCTMKTCAGMHMPGDHDLEESTLIIGNICIMVTVVKLTQDMLMLLTMRTQVIVMPVGIGGHIIVTRGVMHGM
jgi:hypothetical protein